MKNKLRLFGIIAIIAIIGFTMFGCADPKDNDNITPKPCANGHTAGAAATCLTPQTCTTCDAVLQAATGHAFGDDFDWAEDAEAATCTHPSHDTRDCKNAPCTEKDRRTGSHPALGHDLPGAYPATCMEDGNTGIGHCDRCGENVTGETIPREPDNHDFSGEPVITPATCTEDGEEVINCGNAGCNAKHETPIDALEHDWEWTENTISASCIHASKDTAACNNTPCTATNERTGSGPALGHDLPGAKAATCTSTGITGIGHCDRCGEDLTGETIPIDPDNHNFGEWTTKTAATCIAQERLIRVCSHNAAHTEEENHGEINPTAHDWGDGWITKTAATCITPERQERVCSHNAAHKEEQNHGAVNPDNHVAECDRSIYVITGSGAEFTATKGLCVVVGTANQSIQNAVNAIRTHAEGAACTVQFGNGIADDDGETLDIGTASANFSGTWGLITLTGKITSENITATQGTVALADAVSVNSTADITNTAAIAVNNVQGIIEISGGTIRTTTTNTTSTGAIHNNGTVIISGGTIDGNRGMAVFQSGSGNTTISGDAIITSQNPADNRGTVFLASDVASFIEITGGTIRNTVNGRGIAVYNTGSGGTINISGGTIEANNGEAIRNFGTGTITISGTDTLITSANINTADSNSGTVSNNAGTIVMSAGTVRNTGSGTGGGRAIYNSGTGTVSISGGTVGAMTAAGVGTNAIAVWNNSTGTITISGTDTLITSANTWTANGTVTNNGAGTIEMSAGTVRNTAANANANAIRNAAGGTVNISGGTVGAMTAVGEETIGVAVWNNGTMTISGADTLITSANTTDASGTVNNDGIGTIAMSGGMVINTSYSTSARAIRNGSTGEVNISGGTVGAMTAEGVERTSPIPVWNDSTGTITISGADTLITGSGSNGVVRNNAAGTIAMSGGRVLVIGGNVSGTAIRNVAGGTVNISGGTVGAMTTTGFLRNGYAVQNNGVGTINISGADTLIISANTTNTNGTVANYGEGTIAISAGTVINTANNVNARAVYNGSSAGGSTGNVIISGGTVGAMTTAGAGTVGVAVWNNSTGTITISGADTLITSANATDTSGTVSNNTTGAIAMSAGTVRNTANNANANAIRNGTTGTVNISGGTVQANAHTSAHAIRNVTTDTSLITIGAGATILGNKMNCP